MSQNKCPSCGASWSKKDERCSYCGTHNPNYNILATDLNSVVDSIINPIKEEIKTSKLKTEEELKTKGKIALNKRTYVFLALFCGIFGMHKFYERKFLRGAMYFLLTYMAIQTDSYSAINQTYRSDYYFIILTLLPIPLSIICLIKGLITKADKSGNIYFKKN